MIWRAHPAAAASVVPFIKSMSARDFFELEELGRSIGLSAQRVIERGISTSVRSFVAHDGHGPIAIGGVQLHRRGAASCWMIAATSRLERDKRSFLRESAAEVASWAGLASRIEAHVDERWPKSLRWLAWLGFVPVEEGVYMGRNYRVMELRDARVRHLDGCPDLHQVSAQSKD